MRPTLHSIQPQVNQAGVADQRYTLKRENCSEVEQALATPVFFRKLRQGPPETERPSSNSLNSIIYRDAIYINSFIRLGNLAPRILIMKNGSTKEQSIALGEKKWIHFVKKVCEERG